MNKVQIQILKDADDNQHLLSGWEREFVENLLDKDDDYDLSDKQNAVINRIGTKVERA